MNILRNDQIILLTKSEYASKFKVQMIYSK